MNALSTLAAAAALSFTGAVAQAATFNIGFDASAFDFDASTDELSAPGPLAIVGGDLDGSEIDQFFYEISGGAFTDIWSIDFVEANTFTLINDTGSSLVFSGEFSGLVGSSDDDTVVLTISGFAPSRSVIASLRAAPDDFLGSASDVAPIPLPAAIWLLLAGVGALVATGVRRA